jgi:hypothetical protein
MATAGYSGTPLLKKLGIKEEMRIQLIHAPEDYFNLIEKDISDQLISKKEMPDFVHLFAKSKKEFEDEIKKLNQACKANLKIIIWVSWFKKNAGIQTDLTETDIRNYALQNDLVDVKVCAVSEQWSGLKLVVPIAKR